MTFLRYSWLCAVLICIGSPLPTFAASLLVSVEREFTLTNGGVTADALNGFRPFVTGLPELIVSDLVSAVDNPDCNGAVVAWGGDRDKALKEMELQTSRWANAETRENAMKARMLEPNTMIAGHVVATAGGLDVTLTIKSYPSGKVLSQMSARLPKADVFDGEDSLARKLGKELCKRKSFTVKGALGQLQFSEKVCDITKPFTVTAKGPIGALKITFTPSGSEGGKVAAAGTAAFAQWRGSGTYTQALDGKQGKISMTITFSGSIMGHATATTTDTFPVTLTAVENCS